MMENEKRLDLIDRNALLKKQYNTSPLKGLQFAEMVVDVRDIEDAPTVEAVEVVHGRWKDGVCTACDFDIRDMIDGESEFRNWVWECVPYCPNCGADMRGEAE